MQNLSGSNIGEDASNVRHNLRVLASTELPEKDRELGRTEVLPMQWRKHLRLDVRLPNLRPACAPATNRPWQCSAGLGSCFRAP